MNQNNPHAMNLFFKWGRINFQSIWNAHKLFHGSGSNEIKGNNSHFETSVFKGEGIEGEVTIATRHRSNFLSVILGSVASIEERTCMYMNAFSICVYAFIYTSDDILRGRTRDSVAQVPCARTSHYDHKGVVTGILWARCLAELISARKHAGSVRNSEESRCRRAF